MDPYICTYIHTYIGATGRNRNCRFIGKLVKAIPRQWCVLWSFFLWWTELLPPHTPPPPPSNGGCLLPLGAATTICLNERKLAVRRRQSLVNTVNRCCPIGFGYLSFLIFPSVTCSLLFVFNLRVKCLLFNFFFFFFVCKSCFHSRG